MEATMTFNNEYRPVNGKIILLFLITLLVAGGIILKQHAIDRHGEAASVVRQCIDGGKNLNYFQNPITGRTAITCQLSSGKFGIQIIEKVGDKWEEVTSFFNKSKNLSEVISYLKNAGYTISQ